MVADLACRVRPPAGIGVGPVVGERQVGRFRARRPHIERGLRLARDVVDPVIGHPQRELLRGHVGLGERARGTRQLVEVVVAEAVGGGPGTERGGRREGGGVGDALMRLLLSLLKVTMSQPASCVGRTGAEDAHSAKRR